MILIKYSSNNLLVLSFSLSINFFYNMDSFQYNYFHIILYKILAPRTSEKNNNKEINPNSLKENGKK